MMLCVTGGEGAPIPFSPSPQVGKARSGPAALQQNQNKPRNVHVVALQVHTAE